MKHPTDTSKLPFAAIPSPILSQQSPGFIAKTEVAGQWEFLASECLPTEADAETEAALITDGVVLGEPFGDDPLWRPATLPEGWTKSPYNEHSMWSKICDAAGGHRYSVFYKAAYYDRRANIERR